MQKAAIRTLACCNECIGIACALACFQQAECAAPALSFPSLECPVLTSGTNQYHIDLLCYAWPWTQNPACIRRSGVSAAGGALYACPSLLPPPLLLNILKQDPRPWWRHPVCMPACPAPLPALLILTQCICLRQGPTRSREGNHVFALRMPFLPTLCMMTNFYLVHACAGAAAALV